MAAESLKAIFRTFLLDNPESLFRIGKTLCDYCNEPFEALSREGCAMPLLCQSCADIEKRSYLRCEVCGGQRTKYVTQGVDEPRREIYACPRCKKAELERVDTAKRALRQWEQICPVEYRILDKAKLPQPEKLDEVMAIDLEADNKWGIFLVGNSQQGKTRITWRRIKRDIFFDRRCECFGPGAFGLEVSERSGSEFSLREMHERIMRADILFLDDVGKERMTPRVEEQLFIILDQRISNRRITYITTNETEQSLRERFTEPVRADAFIRRIKQYFVAVNF